MQADCSVDYLPVEEYFVPLTANSDAGDDYQNDLYNCTSQQNTAKAFSSTCRKTTFSRKTCKPPRTRRLEDDEAGMAMMLRLKEMKPRAETYQTEEDFQVTPPVLPTDCCHHNEPQGKRKFVISFGANSADVSNDCLQVERNRCQAFWKFIESQPQLLSLIKEGEYEHISVPHLVQTSRPRDLSSRCRNGEILRAKNKALHDEERERMIRRKKLNDALQRKSGQNTYNRKTSRKPKEEDVSNQYADAINEPFKEVMRQMTIFDITVDNPVSIGGLSKSESAINDQSEQDQPRKSIATTSFADDEEEDEDY